MSTGTDSVFVEMKVMMMVCVIALWGAAGGARSCGESRRVYGEKHSLDTAPHARISGERDLQKSPASADRSCCILMFGTNESVAEALTKKLIHQPCLLSVRFTSIFSANSPEIVNIKIPNVK